MCDRTRENVAGVTTSETSEPTSFSKQLPPTGCHCFSLVEPATNLFSLVKSWPRFPISIVLPYTVDATRAGSYGILRSRHLFSRFCQIGVHSAFSCSDFLWRPFCCSLATRNVYGNSANIEQATIHNFHLVYPAEMS